MANEFDPALPSIRQVQTLIKQASVVQLKLVTGDLIIGKLSWQDQNCLCVLDENNQTTIIWRQAIAYLQPKT